MFLIFRFFITLAAIILIGKMVPGFIIENKTDAFFFAIILSAVNAIIRPILILITLPITILTLGLFTFVINLFTFYLASTLSYGVHFESLSSLFFGAFAIWIAGFITNRFIWKVNMH